MKENTSVAPSAMGNWNLPSVSVTVPLLVPFSTTVTPGSGSFSARTTPVTVLDCAWRPDVDNKPMRIAVPANLIDRRILSILNWLRVSPLSFNALEQILHTVCKILHRTLFNRLKQVICAIDCILNRKLHYAKQILNILITGYRMVPCPFWSLLKMG